MQTSATQSSLSGNTLQRQRLAHGKTLAQQLSMSGSRTFVHHHLLLSKRRNIATNVLLDVDEARAVSPSAQAAPARTQTKQNAADWSGLVALLGVAVLWGSYPPALKVLYNIPTPPDAPLMNSLQACLSAAFLVAATMAANITGGRSNSHPERMNPLMAEDSAVMRATLRRDKDALKDQAAAQQLLGAPSVRRAPANAIEHAIASALTWRSTSLTTAGIEIGLWMSLAFSLEVAGLQLTSATKVAFLNQVSILITPLLVHLSGERVRKLEWLACGLGLVGSVCVAADSLMSGGRDAGGHGVHGAVAAGQSNEILGMIFVLISALFFALSTVRLGRYSSQFDSLQLSTASTCTLGLLSLVWISAAVISKGDGGASQMEVLRYMLASPVCVLTLIWVGLGPGALAAYLQATGQKSVPPAQAQVIYSTTPLWAAGFAYLALNASDEAMGSIAWLGAAIMLFSSLITAIVPPEAEDMTAYTNESTFMNSMDSDVEDPYDPMITQYNNRITYQDPIREIDLQGIDVEVRNRQGLSGDI